MEGEIQSPQPSPESVLNVSGPGVGCMDATDQTLEGRTDGFLLTSVAFGGSGPDDCFEEAGTALVATGTTIATAVGVGVTLDAAATAGLAVATSTVVAAYAGVGILAAGAGVFMGLWIGCILELLPIPVGDRESRFAFEPLLVRL